jgi:hypothetical protein
MRPLERIPLHDHSDSNSGGKVAGGTVVSAVGGGSSGGGGGGGTSNHGSLSGVTSDQHHAENHAARHESGGADEIDVTGLTGAGSPTEITDIPTAETDDTLVLAPDGAGGVEWRAETGGSGGALVLLEQHTASSSAALDFTTAISSAYDEYQIEFINVVPATDGAVLWMRLSTDGGSSYDTSTIYDYTSGYAYAGGTGVGSSATSSDKILLMDGVDNSANYGIVGHIRLFNPLSTAVYKQIVGQLMRFDSRGTLGLVMLTPMGVYRSTTAVDAMRFLFDTGNIASGTIRVYGIAK